MPGVRARPRRGRGTDKDSKAVSDILDCYRQGKSKQIVDPTFGKVSMYAGGEVEFPPGTYVVEAGTLDIHDIFGLALIGNGSNAFAQTYAEPISRILVAGAASDYGLRVRSNGARNFRLTDIALEYEEPSFTGHLLDATGCPGLAIAGASFGAAGRAGRMRTAGSLLRLSRMEAASVLRSSFNDARKGIWIPNAPHMMNGLTLRGVMFNDLTDSQLEYEGGGSLGLSMSSCHFDPIRITPRAGAIIRCNGFSVAATIFGGNDLRKNPNEGWAYLEGRGSVDDSYAYGDKTAFVVGGGSIDLTGDRALAKLPLSIQGGLVSERTNEWVVGSGGDTAVEIEPKRGLVALNAGPSQIPKQGGSAPTHSYRISGNASKVRGRIEYFAAFDQSTKGIDLPPNCPVKAVRLD